MISQFCPRFDGNIQNGIKTEPTSIHPHHRTNVLGVYEGKPFVTGSHSPGNKKTEILDYGNQWISAADYPFNGGNQLVSKSFEII